jgi:hypothetical protein
MSTATLLLNSEKINLTPENLQEIMEVLEARGIQAKLFSEVSLPQKPSKKSNKETAGKKMSKWLEKNVKCKNLPEISFEKALEISNSI